MAVRPIETDVTKTSIKKLPENLTGVISTEDLHVYYGDFEAIKGVSEKPNHCFDRTVRECQIHVFALIEPNER